MTDPALSVRPTLTLSELNGLIRSIISEALPGAYWVVAEIADIKVNQKGHCYLELIEKEDKITLAQIRANIWVYEFRAIGGRFRKETGEALSKGMKVLVLAAVTFHEVYGLSLNIKDIDPAYTMGEMARKKKEVIERLRKEGLIDRNKSLDLPLVPQRIAVISSPTAAGYEDFFSHLDNNPYGFRFVHTLFPASMQGRDAEHSVIVALRKIRNEKNIFDLVVIIRGGGSVIELSCFDGYNLAAHVADFPLPVITGIGHEKDDTVVDIVAHTRMKTPTAVAEFILAGAAAFEGRVLGLCGRAVSEAERYMKGAQNRLSLLAQRLSSVPATLALSHGRRLLLITRDLREHQRHLISSHANRLNGIEQALRHLDPANILRLGYSITTWRGKPVKDAAVLKDGVTITTRLHSGTVTSIVKTGKEEKKDGKVKGADLLPGFE